MAVLPARQPPVPAASRIADLVVTNPQPLAAAPPVVAWLTPRRFGVLLALLLFAAFPDVATGTASFFHRDFGVLAYPTVAFQRAAFWQGELPLWNPLSHCGVPFLAQWGTLPLYPGALLYLLLPLPWSLNLFCLAHLWLAGLGMFQLARGLTGSTSGAALAGVAFTFNGLTQSCLLWPNYTVALGWMPWVILWVNRSALTRGGPILAAVFGTAAQLLAGAPELTALTWLAAGLLTLLTPPDHPTPAPWTARGRRVAGVWVLALGLTAAQWLPFLDLLFQSQRSTAATGLKWALPPWGWVNLFAPLFRCEPTIQGTWFQPGQQFFGSVYLGAAVLGLAGLGAIRWRDPRAWGLASLVGFGLAAAMLPGLLAGDGTSAGLPGWLTPRYPVKALLLLAFAVPLLAAAGLAALESRRPDVGRILPGLGMGLTSALAATLLWPASTVGPDPGNTASLNLLARIALNVGILGAIAGALAGGKPARRNLALLASLVLLVVDFRAHLPRLAPTLDAAWLRPGQASPAGLPAPGAGRVFLPGTAEDALLHSRVADLPADFVGKRLALWSNLNLLDRVAKVNGAATLRLRHEDQVETALRDATNALALPVLDFLGVTHHSSPANVTEWVDRSAAALPLVTAGQRPVLAAPERTLPAVLAPGFAPLGEVLLTDDARAAAALTAVPEARVSLGEFAGGRVRFEISTPSPTVAVIAQTWHPHWRATIDGAPVPVWRANHAFQAVPVPAGRHRVELRYRDPLFQFGAVVSSLTLAGLGFRAWRAPGRPW
jgi:hypothetical protein